MTERRMARRYDLSLPVNIRMPITREPRSHSGQTRDISTRGVYFTMRKDLAPGTEVDFTLTLPAEITRGSEVFVRAHGRVIRVDKRSDDDHETIAAKAHTFSRPVVHSGGARRLSLSRASFDLLRCRLVGTHLSPNKANSSGNNGPSAIVGRPTLGASGKYRR
jgi:hypothetical protein